MKRVVVILIILGFGGYLVYNYYHTKTKEAAQQKAEQQKATAFRAKAKTEIGAMVARYEAIDNWEDRLVEGEVSGEKPISSANLEKLWLTGKPILFQGFMKVASTTKPGSYFILVEHVARKGPGKLNVGTRLRLSLECPKTVVDSYLLENPRADSRGSIVAVVAKINTIESLTVKEDSGETVEIKRGIGRCLDVRQAGFYQDMLKEQ